MTIETQYQKHKLILKDYISAGDAEEIDKIDKSSQFGFGLKLIQTLCLEFDEIKDKKIIEQKIRELDMRDINTISEQIRPLFEILGKKKENLKP